MGKMEMLGTWVKLVLYVVLQMIKKQKKLDITSLYPQYMNCINIGYYNVHV